MSDYAVMPLRDYVDTCDYIRGITGKTDRIKSGKLIEEIEEVSNKRTLQGYEQGFEEGIQSEYDKFWNAIQTAGERTDYEYAFGGYGWTDEIFKPKYDMNITHSMMMFRYSLVTDLTKVSINMDFSKSRTAKQIFEYSAIKHIGDFNISGVRASDETIGMFANCSSLHTIDKFTVKSDGTSVFTDTFKNCSALKNITVDGIIGQNISFNTSPLTVASMNSIIACLKDFSSTGGTHTLTFKKDRETMLTADEKAVATNKGWTLVWS